MTHPVFIDRPDQVLLELMMADNLFKLHVIFQSPSINFLALSNKYTGSSPNMGQLRRKICNFLFENAMKFIIFSEQLKPRQYRQTQVL